MASQTPIESNDSRFLKRTACFDQSLSVGNGNKALRRLPWNIVEYQDKGELLEPVDVLVGGGYSGSRKTDKHVTHMQITSESQLYHGTKDNHKGGSVGFLPS